MSRLDSFIRRLTAQRDILNSIVDLVGETQGPVLEFGLGNGRTYDHLRERFPAGASSPSTGKCAPIRPRHHQLRTW
jgi:hypothetical protein